LKFKVLLKV